MQKRCDAMRNPPKPFASNQTLCRIPYDDANATEVLAQALVRSLLPHVHQREFLCLAIGTDRSTGDALGPLVGSQLAQLAPQGLTIYGTLDEPVHAMNLKEQIEQIHRRHPNAFILSVDACLGQYKHIGMISLQEGSLRPGAGVNKRLPEVGDLSFTCVVNAGGFMEYFVLQNTRLAHVIKMAQVMAGSIHLAFTRLHRMAYKDGPLVTIQSLDKKMSPKGDQRGEFSTG